MPSNSAQILGQSRGEVNPAESAGTLVVFADDWGRHPSSCQHLVRHLLPRWRTLWVNTIGMRRPGLSREDLAKILTRLRQWTQAHDPAPRPAGLKVASPRMYPGFRATWQRKLNAQLLARQVNRDLAKLDAPGPTLGLTTLPIAADLVGRLEVDRWVYVCVDDFSAWPGVDHAAMDAMERDLVARVDRVFAVSETLRDRLAAMGRADAELLTHGVDLEHWAENGIRHRFPARFSACENGVGYLFWGLIDARLDADWCLALGGDLALVGPVQDPPGAIEPLLAGPRDYAELPALAGQAEVLVMPYRDLPVTRAMQPLKLLEYLATYRPVVVRNLPATRPWADCCDVVADEASFLATCRERAKTGLPADQRAAREHRLAGASWAAKAELLERVLLGEAGPAAETAADRR